jgi:CDP-4-dehydro-6-deoxyglucose reductase, E3
MPRNLSLSQAARLIGVSRKEIQKKIQQNELVVMEGTVLLEDLKKAYPNSQYEDNTMIEKMQTIMADAVHKMAQSEHEGAQLDALSKRAFLLNQELSQQKAKADFYEELINKLKHKFINISTRQVDKSQIIELQKWLFDETNDVNNTINQSSNQLIENQIQQFMSPHVRLLPSRHDFISDKSETLLESALHAGLAVDYGCNNGKCGKCKMKLVSGKVEKARHTDYVLTNEEKSQNYILSCSHRAISDVVLETTEAVSVDDIPLQKIETKIKNINLVNNSMYILNLKTPRSQRLRFMAGQEMKLSIYSQQKAVSIKLSIASCPCDDMNIQFHLPNDADNRFLQLLPDTHKNKKYIIIEGPDGDFTLDEQSPRALIFIAQESGFASIKSLIEHALALDMAEHIHLYWIVKQEDNLYMKNICRSWNDALDNFFFHPVISNEQDEQICSPIINQIQHDTAIEQLDFYVSGTQSIINSFTTQLNEKGCSSDQIYSKATQL